MKKCLNGMLILLCSLALLLCACAEEMPEEIPEGMAKYTITVTDEEEVPVSGVMVLVCDESTCEMMTTDEAGYVSFIKTQYAYDIHILRCSEGYAFDPEAVYTLLPEGDELTIVIAKAGESAQ